MVRQRELLFGALIAALLALGILYSAGAPVVAPARLAGTVALRGSGFSSRAVYCPPSISNIEDTTRIAVVAARSEALPVSVGLASSQLIGAQPEATPSPGASPAVTAQAPAAQPKTVAGGRVELAGSRRDRAVNVVGYGGAVVASAVSAGSLGAGATGCAPAAGPRWYLPEGSSALGYNERLILYNPFPDEAVARVSFVTPDGTQTKASLSDHAVPAGATSIVRLNAFILKQPLLSIEVDAIRGRLVVWRSLRARARHRPSGEQLSLGATGAHTDWFFPDGALGKGYDERIAILNPGTKAARVSISLLTARRTVQPAKLLNITVPPASSRSVAPSSAVPGCRRTVCYVGAAVSSTNGEAIVAERTIWYSSHRSRGVASEVGASSIAEHWYLGPASFAPSHDVVSVLDPTTADARVSLVLETENGRRVAPKPLQKVRVRAGTQLRLPIERWTAGRPVVVLLTADEQVAAERFSYSSRAGDASALMGRALP